MKKILIVGGGLFLIQAEEWLSEAGYDVTTALRRPKQIARLASSPKKDLVILGDIGVGTSWLVSELVDRQQQPTITAWTNRSYFETPYVRRSCSREEFLRKVAEVLGG